MTRNGTVDKAQEIARAVAALAKDLLGPDVEVIWFGSWPSGTAWPASDIDIALSAPMPISLEELAKLRDAIDRLPTLYTVDLVDMGAVGRRLQQEIVDKGVKI